MSKLFVQVERVEDLIGRVDNYFGGGRVMKVCDCYRQLEPIQLMVGECLGAKNKPRVECEGDESRCLFYSERRRKAKAVTNADRIRAMTDEELAKYISKHVYCPTCPIHEMCRNDDSATSCDEIICEWLKQESESE